PDPLIGRTFDGRYSVHVQIGKGGMGTVYRATQISVGRDVALKVLSPEYARNAEMAGRFVREAQLASRLKHPSTIVIHDFGQSADGLFMAMELLTGESLQDRLRRVGALPLADTIRITRDIAGALAEAHKAKIVHRDIKPDNIFLHRVGDLEVVKVLDFGIAKVFNLDDKTAGYAESYETSVGVDGRRPIIGTWHYMAPEQIEDKPVDHRVDLYALGIMLYEMAAGYKPFQGETMASMLRMHLLEPPLPLPDTVVSGLSIIIHRLLQKDPARRFQSAEDVITALDTIDHAGRPGSRAGSRYEEIEIEDDTSIADRTREKLGELRESASDWYEEHAGTLKAVFIGVLVLVALGVGAWLLREHRRQSAQSRPAESEVVAKPATGTPPPAPSSSPSADPAPSVPPADSAPAAPELPAEADGRAWVTVGGGRFDMGTPEGVTGRQSDEGPVHSVNVTTTLLVRTAEMTQDEWSALVADNPSSNAGCRDCPVEGVNWYEALEYANLLSVKRGFPKCYELQGCRGRIGQGLQCGTAVFNGVKCTGYRLPTEAEWEWLSRAAGRSPTPGTPAPSVFHSGTEDGLQAGGRPAPGRGDGRSRPIRMATPNAIGLQNILGNVWEWVWDIHSDSYYAAPLPDDPIGPSAGTTRVIRGGGYSSPESDCRPGARRARDPVAVDSTLGFRLVRTVDP
ncbi:MAG: SUMF1/EgtB/PvdO family nonheme iron enzyme, partial [Myxococcales bacterium]|nr:SUMF1/EgtB/PvdO family nonheme iron enzyme [Myxococcales bacterium]